MEWLANLLKDPTFTAFVGLILGAIGSSINLLITWRKDLSLVREQSKIEYLKKAMEELKDFLQKAIINVPSLNLSHEEHAVVTRAVYEEEFEKNEQGIQKEYKDCVGDYTKIMVAYMTVRHFLSVQDRTFLDEVNERIYRANTKRPKLPSDNVEIIIEIRIFFGCFYVALLKNLERFSQQIVG